MPPFWRITHAIALCLTLLASAPPARAGAASVDEFTGEATYSIPIIVPPGTAGAGPSLALEYRSGTGKGGAGYVGLGWRIAGLTVIERDLKHGVPYDYETLAVCGLALCYRDDFTLDGQDLICADASCSPAGIYKTQQDDGRRIAYLGETQGWEIEDRDGTKLSYGSTQEARLTSGKNQRVFSWLLERVEDVHGNWVEYHYVESKGVVYPIRIEYAQQGEIAANRTVSFTLSERTDRFISYGAGFRQEIDQNVTRIESRAGGALVAAYDLSYAPSPESQRSLLESVQRIGSDGQLPSAPYTSGQQPYVFSYSTSQGFDLTPSSLCAGGICQTTDLHAYDAFPTDGLIDLNRDGLVDTYKAFGSQTYAGLNNGYTIPDPGSFEGTLWYNQSARLRDGFGFSLIELWSQVIDVDGDGFPDWVKPVNGLFDAAAGWDVVPGSSSGFVGPALSMVFPPLHSINYLTGWDEHLFGVLEGRSRHEYTASSDEYLNRTLIDLTGDGIPEIVYGKPPSPQQWSPAESTDEWLVYPGRGLIGGGSVEWSQLYIDWSDPADDAIEMFHVFADRDFHTITVDVNGDGLPDRLTRTETDSTSEFWVAYNHGAGFDDLELALSVSSTTFFPRDVTIDGCTKNEVIDLNGDGFVDHVVASRGPFEHPEFEGNPQDGWNVRYGTGSGFRSDVEYWPGTGELNGNGALEPRYLCVRAIYGVGGVGGLRDLDGDGLVDRYTMNLREVYLNEGTFPDLLQQVTSPTDASIQLEYLGSGQMIDEAAAGCVSATCDTTQTCSWFLCVANTCQGGPKGGLACNTDSDCSFCGGGDEYWCNFDSDCAACAAGPAEGAACLVDNDCFACTDLPVPQNPDLPVLRPVVSQQTVLDGTASPAIVSTYHYAGGMFDYAEKEFRGFGTVTRTDIEAGDPNVPGTEIVSSYRTDRECAGRLEARSVRYDGNEYVSESFEYLSASLPASAPIEEAWSYCLLRESTTTSVETTPAAQRSRSTVWVYDADPVAGHYNVLERHELGEVVGGVDQDTTDNAYTYFSYADPIGAHPQILSRVSETYVRDAPGVPDFLSHTMFFYDLESLGRVSDGMLFLVTAQHENPHVSPPIQSQFPTTWITYDGFGNVASRREPDGFRVEWTYDSTYQAFRATRTEEPAGPTPMVTTLSYVGCPSGMEPPPGLGLPCQVINPRGDAETFGYDVLGRTTRITRRNGLVEEFAYLLPDRTGPGAQGETSVTSTRRLLDGTNLAWTRLLDGLGRVFLERSPGKETGSEIIQVLRSFDDRGRLATETIPHFDSEGSPLLRVFEYDPLGRPERITGFDGFTQSTWAHEPWKVIQAIADLDPDANSPGSLEERIFDGRGRLREIAHYEDPVGLLGRLPITAEYDGLGRMTAIHNQAVSTILYYDTLGRHVQIDDPDSGTWTFAYTDSGRLARRIQNVGGSAERTQTFVYDAHRRLESRSFSPSGNGSADVTYVYESNSASIDYGRLVEVQSSGTSYSYQYDAAGRLVQEEQTTLGRLFVNQYTYDALDRVKTRTYPDLEVFSYFYDGTRLARIEGTYLPSIGYTFDLLMSAEYDALGRTLSLELGDTLRFRGSPAGRAAAILRRTYDPNSARLQTMTATGRWRGPLALDLTLDFDGLGRLRQMSGSTSGSALSLRSFLYDGLGRLTQADGPWEQPEGNPGSVRWDYSYDTYGNLAQQNSEAGGYTRSWSYGVPTQPRFLTEFSENGTPVDTLVAESAGGNPASINSQAIVWNAQNRMHKAAGSQTYYHYDAFDRRTVQDIQGTDATQIVSIGADFEYDIVLGQANKFIFVNGERVMTRATFYSSTLAWHLTPAYRWIVRPLLIVAIPAGCGLILLGLFSLLGRGFRLDPPAWVAGSGIALISLGLVTLPWSEVRAILGMGSGPGWHGSHTEGVLIYANDHLGSTRVIIDTVGQPVETRDYAPFGRTIAHTGNFALKHQFTSQPYDEANGLQYHGARMYDPRWGRWLSADEALEGFDAQGLNPYAYVRNQPTSRIDPTGALSWGWPGAIPWSPTLQSDGAGRTNNATDSSPVRFGRGQEAIGWYNAGSDFYAQAGSEDGGGPRSEFDGRTGELIGYRYPDGTLIGERNSFDDVVRPTLRVGRLNVALPDRIAIGLLVGSPLVLGFDLAVDIRDLANIRVETLNIRLGFGAAGALSIRSLGLVTTFGEMAGPQSPLQLGAIVAGQLPGVPLGGAVDVRVGSDLRGASVTGGAGIVFGGAVCAPCLTGSVPIRAPRPGAAHQGEMP